MVSEAINETAPRRAWGEQACEHCGQQIGQHCIEDVVDCIAAWRYKAKIRVLREKLHVSLRGALDYGAALALYWWIHNASEEVYGESWPWTWEQRLRDAVDSEAGAELLHEGTAGARELRVIAGGWWWVVDGDPVFVATADEAALVRAS